MKEDVDEEMEDEDKWEEEKQNMNHSVHQFISALHKLREHELKQEQSASY